MLENEHVSKHTITIPYHTILYHSAPTKPPYHATPIHFPPRPPVPTRQPGNRAAAIKPRRADTRWLHEIPNSM